MKLVIKLFGILLILAGISFIIYPEFLFGWLEDNTENSSLYISAIVGRFVLGILLIIAAKESKYPLFFKIFGYLAIIAAIVFIFIGHEIFQHFMASIIAEFKPYTLISGLIVMAIGGLFIYAFSMNKEIVKN